jgi:hypothetical protein
MWLGPVTFVFGVLSCGVFAVICRAEITRTLKLLGAREWLGVATLLVAALLARVACVPATARVYYDEQAYGQIARGIAEEGRAQVASFALVEERHYRCEHGSYPHTSSGWPTLLAGAMKLTRYARWTGGVTNLVLSLATVTLLALLAASLFRDAPVCLTVAACYACLPANALWSRCSAAEASGAFAATLAVLCAVRFTQSPNYRLAFLLAAAMATAAQMRNEAILLVPVCGLFMLLNGRTAWRLAGWPLALALVMLWPQALHLGHVSRAYDPLLTEGSGFGFRYWTTNAVSLLRYVSREPVVLLCVASAVCGISYLPRPSVAIPLGVWIGAAWLLPAFHFGGSYTLPGGERFALAWLPGVSLCAGVALCAIHVAAQRHLPARWSIVTGVFLFIAALLWAGPHAKSEDQRTNVPRRDCEFLRAALRNVPHGSLVITTDPPVVIAEGRSAVFLNWAAGDPSRLRELAVSYAGRLYYFVSPSSSPEHWPRGRECDARLRSILRQDVIAEQSAPEGRSILYQVTVINSESLSLIRKSKPWSNQVVGRWKHGEEQS